MTNTSHAHEPSDPDPEWIKENIDLLEYIAANTNSKIAHRSNDILGLNPCPICNHNDCFRYYYDSNSWYCYSTDHESGGSIIDFVMDYENLEFSQAMNKLIDKFSHSGGKKMQNRKADIIEASRKIVDMNKSHKANTHERDEEKAYLFLIEKYHENVNKTDYFQRRGISDELIEKYKLGYDKEYNAVTLPCFKKGKPALIVKRLVDPDDYKYYNEGDAELFNADILKSDQDVIYIAEGIFDALSIEEATGKAAIALNGGNNVKKLKHIIDNDNFTNRYIDDKRIIYVSDGDEPGIKTREKMENIDGIETKTLDEYKDANNYLKNGEKHKLQGELEGEEFNINFIDSFLEDIWEESSNIIETGFDNLDEILQGGLFSGLYVIGAISSLGKTTFCLQMADQLAKRGKDVLFFSLEQSRKELMGKSIAREISYINGDRIISTMDVLNGNLDREEDEILLNKAKKKYKNIARNLAVIEQDKSLEDIKRRIEKISRLRSSKPVVFVDFLQILDSPEKSMSYRQSVDHNLSELKRLSRDHDVPVIVISSFNRKNYNYEVNFEAFKESGSIEYTSDVVIGLQLTKMQANDSFNERDVIDWKAENPRKIQAVLLKHRNGPIGKRANFNYYPISNRIEELGISG